MSQLSVEHLASALLYEGYLLYPYRRSAVKNRQRFNFGVLYPESYSRASQGSDPCEMQTECLVQGQPGTRLDLSVRFLHLLRTPPERAGDPDWHEAVEREVRIEGARLGGLLARPRRRLFSFPAAELGRQAHLRGVVQVSAEPTAEGPVRLRVRIVNLTLLDAGDTPGRDQVLLHSLVSAHTILRLSSGEFVSLMDPPQPFKAGAAACRNVGTWPVLVGEEGARDAMLSSPIILYDYPRIAPESPGDFFDGTEIDELLSLRILTLTDDEKREMGESDERARRLLERTEALGAEELMRMHGVLREIHSLEETP